MFSQVVASDGLNTGMTFVEITIVDINDNSPEFLNSSYSFSLPEVGSSIMDETGISFITIDNRMILSRVFYLIQAELTMFSSYIGYLRRSCSFESICYRQRR